MKTHTLYNNIAARLLVLLVAVLTLTPAAAQDNRQYAIFNYRNDGGLDAWLNIDIDSITYSCIDTLGIEHDEVVVQEVWTPDSLYRIPIEAIDSIGFRAPAAEFKPGIFIIEKKHMPYIVTADDGSVTFKRGTSSGMLPVKGQIMYSDLVEDPFYMGFAGRVVEINNTSDGIRYVCEPVSPDEVYDRYLEVFKIVTDTTQVLDAKEMVRHAPRRLFGGIADDGTITIPDLEFSVNAALDKWAGCKGNVKIDGKVSNSVEYVICVGMGGTSFVNIKHTKKTSFSLSTSYKIDKFDTKDYSFDEWLDEPIYSVGCKYLGLNIYVGLFFDVDADLEFIAKFPVYKSTQIEEYYFGSDLGWTNPLVTSNNNGGWSLSDENAGDFIDETEVKVKLGGSISFGPVIKGSFQVWKPSFLSFDVRAKGGLELSGECSLDLLALVNGEDAIYNLLSDTKISTGLKIGLELHGTAKGNDCTFASASTTLFKKDHYLFPKFTQPLLPERVNGGWEGGLKPLSIFSVPSNNMLLPGKVGLAVFDEYGKRISTTYGDTWFFGGDWDKSKLQSDISILNKGKTYVIRPLFRMLNISEVLASPSSVVYIPQSMSLGTNKLTLQKGKAERLSINGGWGDYSVIVLDKAVCSAELKQEGDKNYLQIVGLKDGKSTTVTLKDLRTDEAKVVLVTVTNEPVQQPMLKLEPESINFGSVPQGTTKTEYFTVTNIGQSELVFKVRNPQEHFRVSEADVEHRLLAGKSKQFSVTYLGDYAPGSGGGADIRIESNATNVDSRFGLSLMVSGGSPVPQTYLSCPDGHHPHLIDLGLPSGTKWSCCNVGADKPEGYGGYYAWGETEEKNSYDTNTYIHCDGSYASFHNLGEDIAGTKYDVAYVKWGDEWQMPTRNHVNELLNNCTSEWTTINGVLCRKLTGPNGKYIYLPAAGRRKQTSLIDKNNVGYYWTSMQVTSVDIDAAYIYLDKDQALLSDIDRIYGLTVRPIMNPNAQQPTVQTETITIPGTNVSFKMVAVEGGTFWMGSADDDPDANTDEMPRHQVTLSNFAIGETEVTQELWEAVMGSNPSYFEGTNLLPVEKVSWNDSQEFITKLNALTGRTFRLPTEAEWEYAARGGKNSRGYKYAGSDDLDAVAWYWDNLPSQNLGSHGCSMQPVATKLPNELGLYDMSGNVREWCQDWYASGYYDNSPSVNPCNNDIDSESVLRGFRVCRGGSWMSNAKECSVANRYCSWADDWNGNFGFRLALSDGESSPQTYLTCPDDHHPHMIDLGLPSGTLWACCNVGTDKPEGYGDYYAWGETKTKSVYNQASSIANLITCNNEDLDIAGTDYDAARANWGTPWHMPTIDIFKELQNNTSSVWTTQNGVNGIKITGTNGGSIFLPASGYKKDEESRAQNRWGYYWVSSINWWIIGQCDIFHFSSSTGLEQSINFGYDGLPVRPVMSPNGKPDNDVGGSPGNGDGTSGGSDPTHDEYDDF